MPLEEGVLTCNLGIPISLVLCKSELLKGEKINYKDAQLNFIAKYIRKVALSYGFSIFYVSSKKSAHNVEQLYEYILKILYGMEAKIESSTEDNTKILIVPGFDSFNLIKSIN